MEYLENAVLKVAVSEHGAELSGIYNKVRGTQAVWQADPAYWNRHAPILFPFVGKVTGGVYRYKGQEYPMGQHGFARDMDFTKVSESKDAVTFRLVSDEKTLARFPMPFALTVTHILEGNTVRVRWEVLNPSDTETLYFSVGGHPAFNVPASEGNAKHDYFVKFEGLCTAADGTEEFCPLAHPSYVLIDPASEAVDMEHTQQLDLAAGREKDTNGESVLPALGEGVIKLTDNLFDNDAFIFDDAQVARATILYPDRTPYVTLTCKGFPSFGFWSKPHSDAPYVCLEPWIGRCDNKGFAGELKDKYCEQQLAPGEVFTAEYTITVE